MNELNNLPEELPKDTLNWLRTYGYTLNIDDEIYKKVKSNLKKFYPYEYYCYVDLDIKKEAEDYAENYHCVYENRKEGYKTWDKRFKEEKKRLIKKIYGLEKKGIRWLYARFRY